MNLQLEERPSLHGYRIGIASLALGVGLLAAMAAGVVRG